MDIVGNDPLGPQVRSDPMATYTNGVVPTTRTSAAVHLSLHGGLGPEPPRHIRNLCCAPGTGGLLAQPISAHPRTLHDPSEQITLPTSPTYPRGSSIHPPSRALSYSPQTRVGRASTSRVPATQERGRLNAGAAPCGT
mgnify:CR=1 FL=1